MLASSAPAPVTLSHAAEIERQDQVAQALTSLLTSTSLGNIAVLTAALTSPDAELSSWTEELETLRCAAHLGNLDSCRSQHRLFAISFAMLNDPALHEHEMELLGAPETERQAFFNGIYKRIQAGDFSGFGFTEGDFKEAMERERLARICKVEAAQERIQELQSLCMPVFQQRLAESADILASFPWQSIAAGPGDRWRTNTDALTMEAADHLWFVSQAWPTTQESVTDSAAATPGSCGSHLYRDVLMLVDLSGSMCNILPVLKECLQDIVARANEGDRLCLVGFSSEPTLLCDWLEIDDSLSTDGARSKICSCIQAMSAKGGTRIVPVLHLAKEQLRSRPFAEPHGSRSTAVVILSDGDPEEPAEALSSAAATAFAAEGGEAPLVVALALGSESRPDLMALLAQCGCGASLYIAGREQLPSQLGRMWGILGERSASTSSSSGTSQSRSIPPADAFLVLEPADGTHIAETERSPGGTVSLTSSGGRQMVVLRCGRHPPPGDESACCRLAARLRLPDWARAPIDNADLQRPLLRSTWIWHDAKGSVMAASDVLRAVQVPALLIEARVGLPVRVHLDVDSSGCDSFDRDKFLSSLASMLGMDADRFAFGRLSPGSVIADIHLQGADATEIARLHAACAACFSGAGDFGSGLARCGFDAATMTVPGSQALQRVMQWKLAAALEAAAAGLPQADGALGAVVELAQSSTVQQYDCDTNVTTGSAAAVAADAHRAREILQAIMAAGRNSEAAASSVHLLEQQAHAHCQQLCPELTPDAAAVRCYEAEVLRKTAAEFESNSEVRENPTAPAAPRISPMPEHDGSFVHICSGDDDAAAAAVSAFKITVHYGNQSLDVEVPVPAGKASPHEGLLVALPVLESGTDHAIVAMASNGRIWGTQSAPLLCRLVGTKFHSLASPVGRSKRKTRRASSIARSGHEINVIEASATALGTFSLRWEVSPPMRDPLRFHIHVDAGKGAPEEHHWNAESLPECSMSFMGLAPGATYKFSITTEHAIPEVAAASSQQAPSGADDIFGLSITGSRLRSSVSAPALPRTIEGVFVVPPFPKGVITALDADPTLLPLGLPGTFTKLPGTRSRNT